VSLSGKPNSSRRLRVRGADERERELIRQPHQCSLDLQRGGSAALAAEALSEASVNGYP
jgi:hypothetical protein